MNKESKNKQTKRLGVPWWHSWLRIRHCCCCGMGSGPGPATSACYQPCQTNNQKKKKKKKKKKKTNKKKNNWWLKTTNLFSYNSGGQNSKMCLPGLKSRAWQVLVEVLGEDLSPWFFSFWRLAAFLGLSSLPIFKAMSIVSLALAFSPLRLLTNLLWFWLSSLPLSLIRK